MRKLILLAVLAIPAFSQTIGKGTSLPGNCNPGDGFALLSGATATLYDCTRPNTWTQRGSGASSGRVVERVAATNQGGAPTLGFDVSATSSVYASAVTGSQTPNLIRAVAVFPDSGTPTVQDAVSATACTSIALKLYWNTSDTTTSNTVVWTLRTMYIGAGDARTTQTWNTQQSTTANPISTANGQVQTTITLDSGSLTGCVAGKRLIAEIGRDISDTSTGNVELAAIEWSIQ